MTTNTVDQSSQIEELRAENSALRAELEQLKPELTHQLDQNDHFRTLMAALRAEVAELKTELNAPALAALRAKREAEDAKRAAGRARNEARSAAARKGPLPRPEPKYVAPRASTEQQALWDARKAAMELAKAAAMSQGKTVRVTF